MTIREDQLFRSAATILLALSSITALAQSTPASRTWNFDLKDSGTYKLQVKHDVKGTTIEVPPSTEVSYVITIGRETQSREMQLVADQPFLPLIFDTPSATKVRVVINGLPKEVLDHTAVYAFDALSVPPGQFYDPQQSEFKEAKIFRALLKKPTESIDLGRVKLEVDKQIDPSIDINHNLQILESMVSTVKTLPEYGVTGTSKLLALQKYVYQAGEWNHKQPFTYDLEDPLGTKIENKLLPNYLKSKKGNCVTMPLLFVILGQRLGIELTASTAPKHLLVKWKNEAGTWINLEATSGANPARDSWLREQMPMTDAAIANGIYLRPLSRRESAALMITTLAEYYFKQQSYDKAIAIADLVLEANPKEVGMMTLKGSAYGRLNHQLQTGSPQFQRVANHQSYSQFYGLNNQRWFAKAEALGWREESREQQDNYLRKVDKVRTSN